jgi:glutamate-5-semialdehyde dehydrogenase
VQADGALVLIESADRAAGWAMFADRRLSLAVARGSGRAVAQLGSVARQAGIAVSLHGTGGAWMIADHDADAARFGAAIRHSLDRKVCNTLNVCCIDRARLGDLLPLFLETLKAVGDARGHGCKLHVTELDAGHLPAIWRTASITVRRANGDREEDLVDILAEDALGREWEWEDTPEVTFKIVDGLDHAIALFNRYSPHFTVSLISENRRSHQRFFDAIDAPFVGDGFTRWVDGQYALNQPELGLSNWENGRLLARGAILSGNGVFTVRSRVVQTDVDVRR